MAGQCRDKHCWAPDTRCHQGEARHTDCKEWQDGKTNKTEAKLGENEQLLPWTGNSLGLDDVPFVAARSNPKVVGLFGPHNAGKTTLLAAFYLLMGRLPRPFQERTFAGSYSLTGWEIIANSLRWDGNTPPHFPPHTATGNNRIPGLLHMAFREPNNSLRDFLFADSPGEWFRRWAINRNAIDATGAQWLAEHASIFLLIADCGALSGPSRGAARHELQLLVQRISEIREGRPVALVWAKSDEKVPEKIRQTITDAVSQYLPGADEFSVSIYPSPKGVTGEKDSGANIAAFFELLDWITSRAPLEVELELPKRDLNDPFFAYGEA